MSLVVLVALTAPVAVASLECPELNGVWGWGRATKIVVQGDRFLLACGRMLVVGDLSDTSAPHGEGTLLVESRITSLAVQGDLAYVSVTDVGLHIVDLSDPAGPVVIATYETVSGDYPVAVAISNTLAFLAMDSSEIHIVNISNPNDPAVVTSWTDPEVFSVRALAVSTDASALYVAGDSGVNVLDITDPQQPQNLTLVGYRSSNDIVLDGTRMYVTNAYYQSFYGWMTYFTVFNIANPQMPTLLGAYGGSPLLDCFTGVAVGQGIAYVHNSGEGKSKLFNTGGPLAPIADLPLDATGGVFAGQLLATISASGLTLLNIVNPLIPSVVGAYDPGGDIIYRAKASPELAVILTGNQGLQLLDVSSPSSITTLCSLSPGTKVAGAKLRASPRRPSGPLAALCHLEVGQSYDFGGAPCQRTGYLDEWKAWSFAPATWGRFDLSPGFLGWIDADGFRLYDLSNLTDPVETGFLAVTGHALDLQPGLALIGTSTGLQVVDLSAPADPQLVGSFAVSGLTDIAAADNLVVVGTASNGLYLVDITQPSAPVQLSHLPLSDQVAKVVVVQHAAYVANDSDGLRVFDISDLQSPQELVLGSPITPAYDVVAAGARVVVATGHNATVLDTNEDGTPITPSSCLIPGQMLKYDSLAASDSSFLVSRYNLGFDLYDPFPWILFADGFECGDTSAWTNTTAR